jgi:hypothetical protein
MDDTIKTKKTPEVITEKITEENTTTTDQIQIYNDLYLEKIKIAIEKMNKIQHIEILKILKTNKTIKINENKNGVYVNLSFLSKHTINELEKYIQYIQDQTKILGREMGT